MRAGEGNRRCRQFGPVLAAALKGRTEDLADRHAHEGRRGVRPVVDVLGQQEVLIGILAPDHAHRVHVEQQTGRTALVSDFGVEDVGLAEAQVKRLEPLRVLVEQIAQIVRRPVCRRDRQQHWPILAVRRTCYSPRALFPGSPYSLITTLPKLAPLSKCW